MKKTLMYTALGALTLIALCSTTAQASSSMNYGLGLGGTMPSTNCTSRSSDLGLGGGVFVAGTTFCEQSYGQNVRSTQSLYGTTNTSHRLAYTRIQKKNHKIKQQQNDKTQSYGATYDSGEQESTVPEYTEPKSKKQQSSGQSTKQPVKIEKQKKEKAPVQTPNKSSGSHSW